MGRWRRELAKLQVRLVRARDTMRVEGEEERKRRRRSRYELQNCLFGWRCLVRFVRN